MTAPTSISTSAEQTERLGAELASELAGGDVVLISGDLGAGKTTFVRGACRELGVEEPVTSPTFTIGRTYSGDQIAISHLDLYRLESLDGEDPALLDDYLGADRIAFIELGVGVHLIKQHNLAAFASETATAGSVHNVNQAAVAQLL